MTLKKLEQYKTSSSYKDLVKSYPLDTYGVWKVLGEDPNCDFVGPHRQPDLGTFEGKLEDIITYAVELPSFWSWGVGGDIKKVLIHKITAESNAARIKLEIEKQELLDKLSKIDNQLTKL
jgi:hypothetical protein